MLIARAEVGPGQVRDLRIRDGRVTEVGEGLDRRDEHEVLDAAGAAVLPGLHDHHVHLRAAAAAAGSVDLREVHDVVAFEAALRVAGGARRAGEWLRVVGYHESMAGPLDRSALDRLVPAAVPVRVQHRSGALWVVNTAAIDALGLEGVAERGVDVARGHLWRRDDLLRRISHLDHGPLAALGAAASALGITGFTDATPDGAADAARQLARDVRAAGLVQDLVLMGPVGALAPDVPRARLGPVKLLLDDDALPSLDELVELVRAAHREHRSVAVHCVTRVQLVLTLVALETAGGAERDRIEHGSVIPADLVERLAHLGVTVVSQPHFIAERGDEYLAAVEVDDLDALYRLRSLQRAGVPVAAGTDAPFGVLDPWSSIAAATERATRSAVVLGADERVARRAAVDLYLGDPMAPGRVRRIDTGAPADLCILDRPWSALLATNERPNVVTTCIAGQIVYPTAAIPPKPISLPSGSRKVTFRTPLS